MIAVDNISKKYGTVQALFPTSIDFLEGATTVLIGQSGCGKSTLLRILVRLVESDTGTVSIDGLVVTGQNVESLRREIGYVIQDGGLFPHLTARENVLLLANYIGRPLTDQNRRVSELAELVRLPLKNLDQLPSQLSGGQRQRISLMRALMLDPKVLLLDEPLGALDPITRNELQQELKDIFSELKKTVILVTHDMGEAAFFASEIILMQAGRIVQRGSVDDLLYRPATEYVSTFIRAQRSPLPPLAAAS